MNKIKISVIIPVYNTESYLGECLNSVLNQTLKDIEIICVDDESTDNSLSILKQYQEIDNRIKIINNKHIGEGAASARNSGFLVAEGDYLSFLDSDDYFSNDMLEKTYQKAIEHDADVVLFDGIMFDSNTRRLIETGNIIDYSKLPKKDVFNRKDFQDEIFISTTSAAWSKIFKRTFVLKHNFSFQAIYYIDDLLFTFGSLALAKRISVVAEKFIFYRIGHTNAQTRNRAKFPLSIIHGSLAFKELLENANIFDELKNSYANTIIKRCAWNLNTLNTVESYKELYNALASVYLEKLELKSSLTKNLLPFNAFEWICAIEKNDDVSYGFLGDEFYTDDLFFRYSSFNLFPVEKIKKTDRVVLYGYGKISKSFFVQNLVNNYCNLIAWVEDSENLLFPVENVEVLKTKDFDKILITSRNQKDIEEIINKLEKFGIDRECFVIC